DWSYRLLTDEEAALLRRLSVFSGGTSLEAVIDVCGDMIGAPVLDLLTGLVAKSWVVADTALPEARYRLLESVRHYAADRLSEAAELVSTHRRHAQWFAALAERAEPRLAGSHRAAALDELDAEQENFRCALQWAVDNHEAELALRLAGALAPFWRDHGHLKEGRRWLDLALASDGPASPRTRAKALRHGASLAVMLGDARGASSLFDEALRLSRAATDNAGCATALNGLGFLAMMSGAPDRAASLLEKALTLSRASADDSTLCSSLFASAQACMFRGDPGAARPLYEECLHVAARGGDAQTMGSAIGGLGWAMLSEGDYEGADRTMTEALDRVRESRAPHVVALTLSVVARVARMRGDYERARSLADEGLELAAEGEAPFLLERCLVELGRIAQAEGDLGTAARLLEDALAGGSPPLAGARDPSIMVALGEVRLAAGDPARAREHFDEANAAAASAHDDLASAGALMGLAEMAWHDSDDQQALSLHRRALELHHRSKNLWGVVDSLEALGRLASATGRRERAVRLLGAAQALRQAERVGYVRPPGERPRHEAVLASLRERFDVARFEELWAQGAAMAAEEAVAYALRGTQKTADSDAGGWESLSVAEREVARLIERRMTNAEIAERLFISPRTVQSHLSHIFSKLGMSSRRQLAQEAARQRTERQS
ncbi:MAG: LuxR C-terminal-related transcriptional regulator, partial [Actinobacteria bacterium]|nr:LuxR C-terminal-related transcriptional regulator [Actinomycetota bacterium]